MMSTVLENTYRGKSIEEGSISKATHISNFNPTNLDELTMDIAQWTWSSKQEPVCRS